VLQGDSYFPRAATALTSSNAAAAPVDVDQVYSNTMYLDISGMDQNNTFLVSAL